MNHIKIILNPISKKYEERRGHAPRVSDPDPDPQGSAYFESKDPDPDPQKKCGSGSGSLDSKKCGKNGKIYLNLYKISDILLMRANL